MKNTKNQIIAFRCSEKMKNQVEKIANKERRKVSDYINLVLENEIMNNLTGMRWGELTEEQQGVLLNESRSAESNQGCKGTGDDRIINLAGRYYITGRIVNNQIQIEDNAEINKELG